MWCGAIAKTGARMRVAVRRPELAGHLQPLGGVGQINAVQANVRFPNSLLAAAQGADAVINLVGILFPSGKQTFTAVQDEGARHVAEAARAAGAQRAGACLGDRRRTRIRPPSMRAAKRKARRRCGRCFPTPSSSGRRSCSGRRTISSTASPRWRGIAPALPLIGGGNTKFEPVFVGDVAKAVIAGLTGKADAGAPYELGGPEVLTLKR